MVHPCLFLVQSSPVPPDELVSSESITYRGSPDLCADKVTKCSLEPCSLQVYFAEEARTFHQNHFVQRMVSSLKQAISFLLFRYPRPSPGYQYPVVIEQPLQGEPRDHVFVLSWQHAHLFCDIQYHVEQLVLLCRVYYRGCNTFFDSPCCVCVCLDL